MGFILDHLWQSTLFAVVAAVLAWSLRRYHARVRYVVWLVASIKFLAPYAIVASAARLMPWPRAYVVAPSTTVLLDAAEAITTPFRATPRVAANVVAATPSSRLPLVLALIWAAGTVALAVRWLVIARRLRRARIALAPESPRQRDVLARIAAQTATHGVDVVLIDSTIEPGVAGLFKPALFWPRGISDRLTDEQVDAVVIHELAHVRWHDNAAAMLHMAVEALFWFHPLAWWLGARLVDERERGCDEAVLCAGGARQAYAEGILRICEFHVSSPLTCVAGVTGSDLKRRISTIMRGEVGRTFPTPMRWGMGTLLIAFVAAPISLGAGRQVAASTASPDIVIKSDRFEVASVKANKLGEQSPSRATIFAPGERVSVVNQSLYMLIRFAYPGFEDIVGGEKWVGGKGQYGNVGAERFDITAKAETYSTHDQLQTMFRALLAERFKLTLHVEQKAEPVYALTVVRSDRRLGPKLKPEAVDCEALRAPLRGTGAADPCAAPAESRVPGHVFKRSGNLDLFVNVLRIYLDRPVVDRTGLTGSFDWDLVFTPQAYIDGERQDPAVNPAGAPLFTAIQEQLGLKLVPENGGVPVLVIDHAEHFTENVAGLRTPEEH